MGFSIIAGTIQILRDKKALFFALAIFSAIITVIPSHVWAQALQPVVANHVSEQTLSLETTPVHPPTPTAMVLTSSTAYSTSKSATLSSGGVSGTFSATTEAINPGDLAEAVDNPQDTTGAPLTFTTGDNPWFGQDATAINGSSAAQSGVIGNSQNSWLQTAVTGPCSVSFYQKVSSQPTCDTLKFSIDGVVKSTISGEVNWQQKTFAITTAGSHILKWTYAKNASTQKGQDAAWVDNIVVSPTLKLLVVSPNGGEKLASGGNYTITWKAPAGAEKFKLLYTNNNGSNWSAITADFITGTSYDWSVPVQNVNRTACKVKVVGYNSAGVVVGNDLSDAPFFIDVLKITAPNGGESLTSGVPTTIDYTLNSTLTPVSGISFYSSVDNGVTWKLIETVTNGFALGANTYIWTPLVTSAKSKCKVKVVVKSATGAALATDVSDKVFAIALTALPGTLAVNTPALLIASGAPGGAFTPSSITYTLKNTGTDPIDWSATATQTWLELTASGGNLVPGATASVTVFFNGNAGNMGVGYYTDTVTFTNLTNNNGNTSRAVSLTITDKPEEITFVTNGSTFAPVLTVESGATITWTWADGTTSSSPTPIKEFGSAATRINRLLVTPWSALTRINIGYDSSDGGSTAIELVPPQPVVAVSGLEHVAPYLRQWCSSYAQIVYLNFDNFVNLDTIESYAATTLTQVSLHNTPRLSRGCFESCQLTSLDLSESPNLADLRGALNRYPGIDWGTTGAHVWHICTRDNPQITQNLPPMSQFPVLSELFIWNDNQTGALTTSSSDLTYVYVQNNHYTSADFTNGFPDPATSGEINISSNQLTSLTLSGCPGLAVLDASNNNLPAAAVDAVLRTLDSLGRSNGTLDLRENYPPTVTGQGHAASLSAKGWTVNLSALAPPQPVPGSIAFTTENDAVSMEIRVSGNPTVTWYWSDGTTDTTLLPDHSFVNAGHRTHYVAVEPASALTYFGARYSVTNQGISSVSGLSNYSNLSSLFLYQESLTALDLAGCGALHDLHLAANPVLSSEVADKWFVDLDASGVTGGTIYAPAGVASNSSAASRNSLLGKGWTIYY